MNFLLDDFNKYCCMVTAKLIIIAKEESLIVKIE